MIDPTVIVGKTNCGSRRPRRMTRVHGHIDRLHRRRFWSAGASRRARSMGQGRGWSSGSDVGRVPIINTFVGART